MSIVIRDSKVLRLGNIYGFDGGSYGGNVYDKSGLAPSILTAQGGNKQPIVVIGSRKRSNNKFIGKRIVDAMYRSRPPRVYRYYAPTMKVTYGGLGLLVIEEKHEIFDCGK